MNEYLTSLFHSVPKSSIFYYSQIKGEDVIESKRYESQLSVGTSINVWNYKKKFILIQFLSSNPSNSIFLKDILVFAFRVFHNCLMLDGFINILLK